MNVRLSILCVTVSLCLLAQGIILFPVSCMYLELCAHNILISYLLSLCWVHVLYVLLSLTLSHKKSSLRGSVAQTADGNKQGAEPPDHPYHLVGLTCYEVITRQNYFTHNTEIIVQEDGLAMGAPSSALIAEIFLQHLEHNHLPHTARKHKIVDYCRYTDNIFLIFDSTHTNIREITEDFTASTTKSNTQQ